MNDMDQSPTTPPEEHFRVPRRPDIPAATAAPSSPVVVSPIAGTTTATTTPPAAPTVPAVASPPGPGATVPAAQFRIPEQTSLAHSAEAWVAPAAGSSSKLHAGRTGSSGFHHAHHKKSSPPSAPASPFLGAVPHSPSTPFALQTSVASPHAPPQQVQQQQQQQPLTRCSSTGSFHPRPHASGPSVVVPARTCPELAVSTGFVALGVPFTLRLVVPASWRRAAEMTPDDVGVFVCKSLQVCLEGTLKPLAACPACADGAPRLVDVGASSPAAVGPFCTTLGGDTEGFVFDACFSHCANSHAHLGGRVVFALDLTQGGGGIVVSPPVLLMLPDTRSQQQHQQQQHGFTVPPVPFFCNQQQQQQQQQFCFAQQAPQQAATQQTAPQQPVFLQSLYGMPPSPPSMGYGAATTPGYGQPRATQEDSIPEIAFPLYPPSVLDKCSHDMTPVAAPKQGEAKVIVRVWETKVDKNTAEILLKDYQDKHLPTTPGVLDYSWKIAPGIIITFTSFASVEHAQQGLLLADCYMQNESFRQNALNTNLAEGQVMRCVCTCACW